MALVSGCGGWDAGGGGGDSVWARGGCVESGCGAVGEDDGGEEVRDCECGFGFSFLVSPFFFHYSLFFFPFCFSWRLCWLGVACVRR